MTHHVSDWGEARTTVLGSKVALVAGVLSIVFAFAMTGQPTLFNLVMSLGGVAAMVAFAIGLLLLRAGAGRRASAGFAGLAIAVLALAAAYSAVDPLRTPGSAWQVLDVLLVLVGDVAALAGGILLGASLGSLTGRLGIGRASGVAFLVGGILQMAAGIPDAGGIIANSTSLGDIGHVLDGAAGLVYVVAGPVLLYLAVRRLQKSDREEPARQPHSTGSGR